MRVLIGCERSGVVRRAFRALGHDAWSCDVEPADDGSPFHIQGDVLKHIGWRVWGLLIAHPPCTYLCSSGLHWNKRRPGRAEQTNAALRFVAALMNAEVKRICIENPVGCISTRLATICSTGGTWLVKPSNGRPTCPATQTIQPYQFGDDASKATCLWLKNLPALVAAPEQYVKPRMVCKCGRVHTWAEEHKHGCPECGPGVARPRWANQTDSGQNRLGPGPARAKERSQTYPGIAKAMAEQWGKL